MNTNIYSSGTPELNRSFATTLAAGTATTAAIISGKSYTVLQIAGGNPELYSSITIDATTGVISTTGAMKPGEMYTIYLRNTGSYNITVVVLTITGACCAIPFLRNGQPIDNETHTSLLVGNVYLASERRGPISFEQLMSMKKALASKI